MKDRNITTDEINKIRAKCPAREQAFTTMMTQSGLSPCIIKRLKIGDVERILESNPPTPCRIRIQHEKFPTFVGEESIKYIKRYLRTRNKETLTQESLLFTIRNNPNKEINTKDVSRTFKQATQKLNRTNEITHERTHELRLYSLVGFYRAKTKDYLPQLQNYHTPEEDELVRRLYEKEVMPFLEIEGLTDLERHKIRKRLKEIEALLPKEKEEEKEWEDEYDYVKWTEEHREEIERELTKHMEEKEKWRKEHPEEARLQDEQEAKEHEEYEKYAISLHIKEQGERIAELENRLKAIEEIVKKTKSTRA